MIWNRTRLSKIYIYCQLSIYHYISLLYLSIYIYIDDAVVVMCEGMLISNLENFFMNSSQLFLYRVLIN
jgi:hypothetical protein